MSVGFAGVSEKMSFVFSVIAASTFCRRHTHPEPQIPPQPSHAHARADDDGDEGVGRTARHNTPPRHRDSGAEKRVKSNSPDPGATRLRSDSARRPARRRFMTFESSPSDLRVAEVDEGEGDAVALELHPADAVRAAVPVVAKRAAAEQGGGGGGSNERVEIAPRDLTRGTIWRVVESFRVSPARPMLSRRGRAGARGVRARVSGASRRRHTVRLRARW